MVYLFLLLEEIWVHFKSVWPKGQPQNVLAKLHAPNLLVGSELIKNLELRSLMHSINLLGSRKRDRWITYYNLHLEMELLIY